MTRNIVGRDITANDIPYFRPHAPLTLPSLWAFCLNLVQYSPAFTLVLCALITDKGVITAFGAILLNV